MLSFSTCWNSSRHTDGGEMLREIRDLGFDYAELGHGVRISLVEGILKAVEGGVIRISSIHNFCPLPPGFFDAAPNIYQFSAREQLEWDNAVRHTRNSIDFAARIGAPIVVIHCGKVQVRRWTQKLVEMVRAGQRDTPKYGKTFQKAQKERLRHEQRYFAQTIKSLHVLAPYAADKHVKLGVETRYAMEEIPNEAEMNEIMRLFPGETVGYWHDCGHAHIRETLGIGTQRGWLERYSNRLLGIHLHDVGSPGADHFVPGDGMIDFNLVAAYFSESIPAVLEVSPAAPEDRVRAGADQIKALMRVGETGPPAAAPPAAQEPTY